MRKNQSNTLGIDWGAKYVGMAYVQDDTSIIMPIGYIQNDASMFFNIGDIISKYKIKKVVVGYPNQKGETKDRIDGFIKQLTFIVSEDATIIKINEDYSSVQAQALTGQFQKDSTTDTLAAMQILQNYLDTISGH